jgi:hypothetical protein
VAAELVDVDVDVDGVKISTTDAQQWQQVGASTAGNGTGYGWQITV